MGKGGSDQKTTSKSYTSQLPEYAEGYYKKLIASATGEYENRIEEGLDPNGNMFYKGPRRAGPSQEELAAADMRRDMFYNPNTQYSNYAISSMNRAAEIPGQMREINPGRQFDAGIASQYMNPYTDAVTSMAANRAETRYQQDADQRREGSAIAGGRGGYREAIMDVTGQAENQRNIGEIWAQGRDTAYRNAQSQYEADMRRSMDAGIAGNNSKQALMNSLLQSGNQALAMGGEQNRQDYQNISQFEGIGQALRSDRQAEYDLAYNEWLNQRDWGVNQYSSQMGLLAGMPVEPQGIQREYASQPSITNQLIGAGIGAGGIYSTLAGGK